MPLQQNLVLGVPSAGTPSLTTPSAGRSLAQSPPGVRPDTPAPHQRQQVRDYKHHTRVARGQQTRSSRVPGYDTVDILGHGGMSEAVMVVKERASGKLYVEKVVSFVTDKREKRARAELKALQALKGHDNINAMKTYLWQENVRKCSLILEYCEKDTLYACMKDHRKYGSQFHEDGIWHIMGSVAKALVYMHTGLTDYRTAIKGPRSGWDALYHLDTKPANIFFSMKGTTDRYPCVVLGDFGCAVSAAAVEAGEEHPRKQPCGTPQWYPPEGLVSDESGKGHYGTETDIWQLGATIHTACILSKEPDRKVINTPDVIGGRYSPKLMRLVLRCTERDYRYRISAAEVLQSMDTHGQSAS